MKICGKPAFAVMLFLISTLWNAASAADFTACNLWYEKPERLYSTGYQLGAMLPAGEISATTMNTSFVLWPTSYIVRAKLSLTVPPRFP